MTFWPLINSDFSTTQTFHKLSWPWYRAWPSSNYECFQWNICNGCGMPAGNAYPSGHLVPSPFLGLACVSIVETRFLELAMSLLDYSPWIPHGPFSNLLRITFGSFFMSQIKRLGHTVLSSQFNDKIFILLYCRDSWKRLVDLGSWQAQP